MLNKASHVCDALQVWRYDKAEWNLLITLLIVRLFVLMPETRTRAHTHLGYWRLPPCGLAHLPAPQGWVSHFSDDATSNQWAVVRTVRERGGNSPPISPLSTWEPLLPQGGAPSRPLSQWTPNKKLSLPGELHESVLGLFFLCGLLFFFPPPSVFFFFIHDWHTALHFGTTEKVKKTQRQGEKTNSRSVGTSPRFFFLVPGAFISINSAYTGICAPVALD